MKKIFMAVIALMMTVSASAQFYIYCSDGNAIKVDSISMVAPESGGGFSVSAAKQVTFSKGNLQYNPANKEWRFAPSQLDYIGDANTNISPIYNGWIDLFGWGTGANPTMTSENNIDYHTFVDWGTNNIGNDTPNTWRTLTYNEWEYLLEKRQNANILKGDAEIKGVKGVILLPNDWNSPANIIFTPEGGVYTIEEWKQMEQAGAVFLPASPYRYGTVVHYCWPGGPYENPGRYWTSTDSQYEGAAAYMEDLYVDDDLNRYYGLSVRLVKDL